ncbi:hypothetical protein [Nocardia grenadensis]|uniref:hypothetical protein n=1 Tax=Nocardia grenadensis TaxID=931537 RepID=UPI003D8B87D9
MVTEITGGHPGALCPDQENNRLFSICREVAMASVHTRLSRAHIWLLTLSSMAGALAIAAMAALYTALPEIAADTGATQQRLTWVIDGYTLAPACPILFSGALGDRFGRRIMRCPAR